MIKVEIERSGVAKVSEPFGLDSYSNMAYAGPCWLGSQRRSFHADVVNWL
jgi:hypothetical protein